MYILVLKGRRRHVGWVCWIFNIISINNKKEQVLFSQVGQIKQKSSGSLFILDDNVQERSSKISIYNKGENRLRHPV